MRATLGLNGVAVPTFTRQVSMACALPPGCRITFAWGAFIQVRRVAIEMPPPLKKASPG